MKFTSTFMVFIILAGFLHALRAQSPDPIDHSLKCAEKYFFGTDDLLVNGRKYLPSDHKAAGHPYFQFDYFSTGSVYIRDRVFEPVDILYHLEKDQLILKHQLSNKNFVQLVVTSSLVDSFRIAEHLFVHMQTIRGISVRQGYIKKIYAGKLQLYQKMEKDFQAVFTDRQPYGRYGDATVSYYLLVGPEGAVKVKNKKGFLTYFGDREKAIRRYMKKQSIRFSKATDVQLVKLMKFCDEPEI